MIKYLVSHLATFSMWPIGRGTGGQLGQPDYIQLKLTKTKEVQPCSQDLYRCGPTHIEQWISGERREFLILLFRKSLVEKMVNFDQFWHKIELLRESTGPMMLKFGLEIDLGVIQKSDVAIFEILIFCNSVGDPKI